MQTARWRQRLIRQMSEEWNKLAALKCAAGILTVAVVSIAGAYGEHPIHDVTAAQQMAAGWKVATRSEAEVTRDRHVRFQFEHGQKSLPRAVSVRESRVRR